MRSAAERLAALRLELARQEREPQSYGASAQIRFLVRAIREIETEIAALRIEGASPAAITESTPDPFDL